MNALLSYILQTTIAITVFYLLYWLLLSKETFFRFNRYYFLVSMIIALVLPFLNIASLDVFHKSPPVKVISQGYTILQSTIATNSTNVTENVPVRFSRADYLLGLYLLGFLILFFRLVFQAVLLVIRIQESETIELSGSKIVLDKKVNSPFSFFSWIFLNPVQINDENIPDIILHEKEHIRQMHSLDLFLIELLSAFQWMNPFIWFFRKSLKETHEYLADHAVLKHGVPVDDYQKLLLSYAFGIGHPALITPLNFSVNKKRMIMMKKMKSPNIRKWRSLLLLPVILILSLAFANPFVGENTRVQHNIIGRNGNTDSLNFKEKVPSVELYILDGKEISMDQLKTIRPESISVKAIKGEDAVKMYGEKAKNGVVIMTSSNPFISKNGTVQSNEDKLIESTDSLNIREKVPSVGLYILDGKEISMHQLKAIRPELISVKVIKGEDAVKMYGEKAKNGVVIITSKGSTAEGIAQKYNVSGKVMNAETRKPMPGVNIVIVETTMGTVSDIDGTFSLQLDKEKVKVAFSFVGFETQILDMKNGDKTEVLLKKVVTTMNLDVPKKQTHSKTVTSGHPEKRNTTDKIFFVVEDMPYFPGGKEALNAYISSQIKYPRKAKKNNIEGKVFVNFTIDKVGNVQNVYVDKSKSIDPDLDKEAIRLISGMPKWKPAKQRGKAVPVELSVPVEFNL